MRSEVRLRITRDDGVELDVIRAQDRDVADVKGRARDLHAVEVHVEVAVAAVGHQVGDALNLRDAGELPAVDKPARDLILRQVAQVNRVGRVEDMAAVRRQHSAVGDDTGDRAERAFVSSRHKFLR